MFDLEQPCTEFMGDALANSENKSMPFTGVTRNTKNSWKMCLRLKLIIKNLNRERFSEIITPNLLRCGEDDLTSYNSISMSGCNNPLQRLEPKAKNLCKEEDLCMVDMYGDRFTALATGRAEDCWMKFPLREILPWMQWWLRRIFLLEEDISL